MHHLDAHAVVVRGGLLADVSLLEERALGAAEPPPVGIGFASLSVRLGNIGFAETVDDVIYRLCYRLLNHNIRLSTAGRLFEVGLDLIKTRPNPHHYSVPIDTKRLTGSVEDFIACFDEPIQNPR